MGRICKKCGSELPEGTTRCIICGEEYVPDEATRGSGAGAKGGQGGKKRGFPLKAVLVGAVLIISAAGAFGALSLSGAKGEPAKEEPVKEEPVKEEPAKEEPAKEEPVKEEPVKEEPAKEEPAKEEPVKEEPVKEVQIMEDPVEEEPEEEHISPRYLPEKYFVYKGHTYGTYNASNYELNDYWDVVEFCREQGGYLAVINDQAENNKLFDFVSKNYPKTAFFGYSDELHEGNWVWEEGGSKFENWTVIGQDQPDNGSSYGDDEDYAEFNYERGTSSPNDGTWNDASFRNNTDTFICEWEYEF